MAEETKHTDPETGVETTGHEWDGIRELNNPMPRWWLWTFYGTVAFALVYCVLYPAVPLVNSATAGILGYSTRGEAEGALMAARAAQAGETALIEETELAAIGDDPTLHAFALQGGKALFRTHCSTCHGAGAAGATGYPNLVDDDWLWGGRLEDIHHTIAHGIRAGDDPDSRFSEMPAFGDDGILTKAQIAAIAEHVLALSDQPHEAALAADGASLYADNCAACHGEDGGGNREMGAPRLSDPIWLYGGERRDIIATITHARAGMMPAWTGRLTEAQVKKLALYVHALGGGE